LRPGTPENLPTISAHPTIKNLFMNTGHFRYGLTMAPASAKLVTALILEEKPMIDAMPYACVL
jgi:glycine oxidase